jgi:hypothetical protein
MSEYGSPDRWRRPFEGSLTAARYKRLRREQLDMLAEMCSPWYVCLRLEGGPPPDFRTAPTPDISWPPDSGHSIGRT